VKLYAAKLLLIAVASAASADAAEFRNSYLHFDLPSGWTCDREETEFVCDPPHVQDEKSSAVMILTAKIPGPDDGLTEYEQLLQSRAVALGRGSMIRAPTLADIGGTIWVDATLKGSEVPNYQTRYLATVKNGIAILFTFSAHQSAFSDLEGSAILAVQTLQVLDDWRKSQ
jgi:hypothetical protein